MPETASVEVRRSSDPAMPDVTDKTLERSGGSSSVPPALATFIAGMMKATKKLRFYPADHPGVAPDLEKSFQNLLEAIGERSELSLDVRSQKLLYMGEEVTSRRSEHEVLGRLLALLHVRRLAFERGVTKEEFVTFLLALCLDYNQVISDGGFEKALFDRSVEHIAVNETSFLELLSRAVEQGRQEEKPGGEFGEGGSIGASQGEGESIVASKEEELESLRARMVAPASGEPGAIIRDDAATVQQIEINPLEPPQEPGPSSEEILEELKALEEIDNPAEYGEALKQIIGWLPELIAMNALSDVYRILLVISNHASGNPPKPVEVANCAAEALAEKKDPAVHEFLIGRLQNPNCKNRQALNTLISQLGKEMLERLIEDLIMEEAETTHRRHLIQAIGAFGETAVAPVEKSLSDNRWYVVRNMAAALGEIGQPKSVGTLRALLSLKDMRIQREVLKALAKIKADEALDALIDLYRRGSHEIRLLAVFSLGLLQDGRALPHISRSLRRALLFTRTDLAKESIKALAKLQNPEGTSTLTWLLRRTAILSRKKNREIQITAARALGKIQGADALEALQEGAMSEDVRVARACRQALSRRAAP